MTKRRDKRIIPFCTIIFAALFAFVFLINKNNVDNADAADLSKFNPGNIISDYTMSNYNSMTEAEIQNFLTSKNSCNNRDYSYYEYLSNRNPGISWHWKDNHFVCLSEELFGDGMVIGEGKTAARIIYETAQEYRINPQVLLVLIQKESGLITDPIPNSLDYRTMTGFGCPDTAPCDSQYFGFKNQIRKAAWLFREVLDGGWTNYPLGENYVQYNPDRNCGGSIVNIENLATSSLYRYTPYQPNAAALAAGTGTAYCGAYGNRNFYAYFSDWFGDPRAEGWVTLENPRYFIDKKGEIEFYEYKKLKDNEWCLSKDMKEQCIALSELQEKEWEWVKMESPRFLELKNNNVEYVSLYGGQYKGEKNSDYFFAEKTYLPDGTMCLKQGDGQYCIKYSDLKEKEFRIYNLEKPRIMTAKEDPLIYNIKLTDKINDKKIINLYFTRKILLPDNQWCLIIDKSDQCVVYSGLEDAWRDMEYPRDMILTKETKKDEFVKNTEEENNLLPIGMKRKFVSKIKTEDGAWCLRTEYDYERNNNRCIKDVFLDEV